LNGYFIYAHIHEFSFLLADLDVESLSNLRSRGKQARALILNTPFPTELNTAISEA
jgi:pyruvate,water dikinase